VRQTIIACSLALFCSVGVVAAQSATLHPITGPTGTTIEEISADGSVAIGNTGSAGAFRWPVGGTIELLGAFTAHGVNAAGSVVVGDDGFNGVRWVEGTGIGLLPSVHGMESVALATCSQGEHVVGRTAWDPIYREQEAFVWTSATGSIGLGFYEDDQNSGLIDVCADGSIAVGWSGLDAVRWTEATGFESIGSGTAYAISADRKVIVGQMVFESDRVAFHWTADTGQVPLEPVGASNRALDVSGDGSVILGKLGGDGFIWDKTHGMRAANDVLTIDYGLETTVNEIKAVSADARTLALINGVAKLRFAPHHSPWLLYEWNTSLITWPPVSGAISSNTYRGNLADLVDADEDGLPDLGYGDCMNHLDSSSEGVTDSKFRDNSTPMPGTGYFYVIGYESIDGPRALGWTSSGLAREVLVSCP
jgi:uncharacterized membrane protein